MTKFDDDLVDWPDTSTEGLFNWLMAKYERHQEIEDKHAALRLRIMAQQLASYRKKERMAWLNGHTTIFHLEDPRPPISILLGTGVHCIGCGKDLGTTTVGIDGENWTEPEGEPDWPFEESKCPVCYLRNELINVRWNNDSPFKPQKEDLLTKRMLALRDKLAK